MKMQDSKQKKAPIIDLPGECVTVIEKAPGRPRQYLGQPDLVMLNDEKTLFSVYPVGHGAGEIVMQVSKDKGQTWKEFSRSPKSWRGSLETPTLYQLNRTTGEELIILISGCPNWKNNTSGGWQTSLSADKGDSWGEFRKHHTVHSDGGQNFTNVAMSSLIQLKDESGADTDQWLGVYHNEDFVNYKTILSFDADGQEVWSKPVPMLSEFRKIEKECQICEIGFFRSPDGSKIVGLGRTQSHAHRSVIFYSEDEGNTWSRPNYLSEDLHGERHKAVYDPKSGRLVVTFREIFMWKEKEEVNWTAGNWAAWVGSFDQLMNGGPGDCKLILAEDFTQSPKSGDTGYAGIVADSDGKFILHSYGHFDKEFSENWSGPVTEDLSYIIQATFKLDDILDLINEKIS